MKPRLLAIPALLCALGSAGAVHAADRAFLLASTTSTEHSGLFAHIVPQFRAATGIDVRVVSVGTGQAFTLARNGDADALLVHDTAGEEMMVREGFAIERRDVMYNDYVIVGPRGDPADVRSAASAAAAFERIAGRELAFASRGDDSGTHRAETRVWAAAGIQPRGAWYRELGSGMGATLNTAAGMNAYVLADRGTWATFSNRQELEILFEGDPVLFNQYGSVKLNPKRFPHLKNELAAQWHEWLLSEAGQSAIASFAPDGEPLFFPNAR